jgi:hypothetical protein
MDGADDALGDAATKVDALSRAVVGLNANIDTVLGRREEVSALAGDVGDLETYGKTNRRFIKLLALTALFDIVLSLGLGGVAWKAVDATHSAQSAKAASVTNAANAHQTCLSNNDARAQVLAGWTKVFHLFSTPRTTVSGRATITSLQQYFDHLYAPRDCNKLAPLAP